MRPTPEQLEALKPYATEHQLKCIDAILSTGDNYAAAARVAGVSRSTLRDAIDTVNRKKTVLAEIPAGQNLKGVSTLVDGDGNIKQQWVKTQRDLEQEEELLKQAVEAACSGLKREKPLVAPKITDEDLLNTFILTDYHIGMRSWPEETGEAWDTDLAEGLLYKWFEQAVRAAPKAHTALLGQLGDFLHWDGLESVTPASKHPLDADDRYQKLVRVAIRVTRRIVRKLLRSHQHVHIVMAEGNHDESGSAWLRELFHALYEDEDRVTVDRTADIYYVYEWGDTSLFFHHGHKRRPEKIDDVFAAKFRDVFGRTKHSYAHMGHLHHTRALETNLMIVEQHRTLAAKDAYASRGGYLAGRSASVITYHKQYGEVARATLSPDMIQ